MEINNKINFKNIDWLCKTGLFIILILPVLAVPPWIFPPDWGKTIIFRCIFSAALFLFFYNLFYKNGYKFSELIKNLDFKKNIIFWLLAAFAVLLLLSSIFSVDPLFSFLGSPDRGGGSINLIFYIIFSATAFLVFKKEDWQKAWNISLFTGVLVSLIAIFQAYGLLKSIFIPFEGRPPSVIGGPIFLATYLLLLCFITISLFAKEQPFGIAQGKNKRTKIFYIFDIVLFLYVILLTGSRAAYVGLLAGFLYFFFFYSFKFVSADKKRLLFLSKILALVLLAAVVYGVFYINYGDKQSKLLKYLETNKKVQGILSRLSIQSALNDPRFSAWQVGFKSIKERPILGWGPENYSVAFDKYYDPSLPFISKQWGGWWDRAHNLLLETAVTEGIPAMLIYLSLFIVLFWQIQKSKSKEEDKKNQIMLHGIQSALIAYFVDLFFTFDTFVSYIIFFLLVSYSLHLINKNQTVNENSQIKKQNNRAYNNSKRRPITIILFCVLLLFLWKDNIKPFFANIQKNIAEYLVNNKECSPAFQKMDKIMPQHSFLDSYLRVQYVSFIKKCAQNKPENSTVYAEKGIELLSEAIKTQPLYTRSWIFLGAFSTVVASSEKDQAKKNELLSQAKHYLEKAAELAPNHQEIVQEQAKIEMVKGNYQNMKTAAEKCVALDKSLGECYFTLALSQIYLKDPAGAAINMKKAEENRYYTDSAASLVQLVNVYAVIEDYKNLAATYESLIKINSNVAQYHSSLAFAYAKLGEYKKSREQTAIFLQLMPEAKNEVDAFLKTLPY